MNTRSGYCAIAGKPNSGKSTLLNKLCGQNIALVTDKPQTTRERIIGIRNSARCQTVFIDTPGLHDSSKPLNMKMIREAESAAEEADAILYVADAAAGNVERDIALISKLPLKGKKVIAALNKIDRVPKEELLPMIKIFSDAGFHKVIPISALKGDGVEILAAEIESLLPEGPKFYPDDEVTVHDERFLTAEIIRGKVYDLTHSEIPYSCRVEIDSFVEKSEGLSVVHASIYVEKESQKGILVGKSGEMIKRIGQRARQVMERDFGRRFFLGLKVKVDKDWTKKSGDKTQERLPG